MGGIDKLELQLDHYHSEALAQLVKRLSWDAIRENAIDDDEAWMMKHALYALQKAMADAGYSPR